LRLLPHLQERSAAKIVVQSLPGLDGKNASVHFLTEYIFGPLGSMTSFEEHESPENPFLFVVELLWG